jgi:hypothetical protein
VDARVEVEAVLGAGVTTVTALGLEACVALVAQCGAREADERSLV